MISDQNIQKNQNEKFLIFHESKLVEHKKCKICKHLLRKIVKLTLLIL